MGIVELTELADAISEVELFIDSRANKQIVPLGLRAYFAYIVVMGTLLAAGAAGAMARKWWGQTLIGVYLALHAALFINFQEINPKILGLVLQAVMLFALIYLRPSGSLDPKLLT